MENRYVIPPTIKTNTSDHITNSSSDVNILNFPRLSNQSLSLPIVLSLIHRTTNMFDRLTRIKKPISWLH